MIESILTFLSENYKIITGAALTDSELIIIAVNCYRKTKASAITFSSNRHESVFQKLIWACNPINLFRKP